MEDTYSGLCSFLRDHQFIIGGCLIITGSAAWLARRYLSAKGHCYVARTRVCGVDYPKDKVILHCPKTEGKFVPSDSPFVMKLETYLRVAQIPYEACFDLDFQDSPKGKVPWIEYNGITMGDSQLIMSYLNEEFKVDLNRALNHYDRAIAWGLQKWLEDSTYWLNSHIRWVIFIDEYLTSEYMSAFYCQPQVKKFIKDLMTNMTHAQGVGRHSNEEVFKMMLFDIDQLAAILGTNTYIIGDRMTELDCFAFGLLCQVRYQTPDKCPGKQRLNDARELKNLREYMDRITIQYWPDWNERLLK